MAPCSRNGISDDSDMPFDGNIPRLRENVGASIYIFYPKVLTEPTRCDSYAAMAASFLRM